MPTCETCGNDYDKSFQVILNGKNHIFDSFECAIKALAPICPHCGTQVVGHGEQPSDDVSKLSDAELIQQLADQAKQLGVEIDLSMTLASSKTRR
jgi:hypothetical protein